MVPTQAARPRATRKQKWLLFASGTACALLLVLVGDAPPHVGYGSFSVQMARHASQAGLTTHVIEADADGVKHFPDIALAGGGRCVSLGAGAHDSLIVEIAGLTLGGRFGDAFREFFRTYLELCR